MKFSDIPGLPEIKKRLIKSAREGKIAHAQLFIGRDGALNLPLALAYTSYLHCSNKGEHDACGECPACTKNAKYIHPDTHFVFPISNIKGDKDDDQFRAEMMKSWRSFLLAQPFGNLGDWTTSYGGESKQAIISKEESREIIKALALKPFESPIKVMIIWQPEYMHPFAANGILKILEEPPRNTFFLLVSNNPERLLPTTLSRTQQVSVPMLTDDEVDGHMKNLEPDEARRSKIVGDAEGNLRLAMELTGSEVADHHEQLADWLRACYKKDASRMLALAEEFHQFDKLQQHALLGYALTMMREVLLAKSGATNLQRSRAAEKTFVENFSKLMRMSFIELAYQLINDAGNQLERNGSAKMIFLDTSLQLSKAMN